MKRKLVLLSALLLVIVSGCSQPTTLPTEDSEVLNSPSSAEAAPPGEPHTPGEDIVITMAISRQDDGTPEMKSVIKKFNEMDNGYRIEIKNYFEYYESDQDVDANGGVKMEGFFKADFQLQMDVIQGGVVDIVPVDAFMYTGRFDVLEQKGAFIDLNPFLEQDEEINRTTLNSHILDLAERDGKLYSLPIFYRIETIIGRSDYVGTKENWTFDELLDHWDKMPEGTTFNYSTSNTGVYRCILRNNIGRFLDYENACCYFDSPNFVRLLEFCNTFPPEDPNKLNPSEDTINFVSDTIFESLSMFHRQLQDEQGYANTLVGYPSEDGSGAFISLINRYGICMKSSLEVQEGAWQFFKILADEEYQQKMCDSYDTFLTTNNEIQDRWAQELISGQGHEKELIESGQPTQADYEKLKAYVNSINHVNDTLDSDLQTIIDDELSIMFEGRQTPQQTADAIQNRASIYVSEKAG